MIKSNSSGSGSQSTKEKFETQLFTNSNSKKTKKRSKRSMPKMKSDIEYSSIFNTKNSSSNGGSKASIIQILKFNAKTNKI